MRIVEWARQRVVEIRTVDGVTYRHFPCGYGVLGSRDAGWTNDLSMLGSGLVWAYEVTGDPTILADAVSFAEYFVQPWRSGALDSRGYWACGTWRDDLGSWNIGPAHFTGFESTDFYGDEASWVFSTLTCTDYLMRLYAHRRDPRFLDRCVRAADWVFRECQFDDGAVGMCGRDDKWLGFTAHAIRQVAMVRPWLSDDDATMRSLRLGAKRACEYLVPQLIAASLDDHGVEWVTRSTSIDPLVNVAMLWAGVPGGIRDSQALFGEGV